MFELLDPTGSSVHNARIEAQKPHGNGEFRLLSTYFVVKDQMGDDVATPALVLATTFQ